MLQVSHLFPKFDELHAVHGSKNYMPVYGGGQIKNPDLCLIFMNPTAKNVSAVSTWNGIRAPWIGTKNVWRMIKGLKLLKNPGILDEILKIKPADWTVDFAEELYTEIANSSLYLTNIAKCTQDDAKHLPDSVYKEYLPTMLEEIEFINPKVAITLGNQVSSIILQKPISVSKYQDDQFEKLQINGKEFKIYPTYYPVGQGQRNLPLAMKRIRAISF